MWAKMKAHLIKEVEIVFILKENGFFIIALVIYVIHTIGFKVHDIVGLEH